MSLWKRTSGEGRLSYLWLLRGLVSSLSPRIEHSCWAMTACCSTEQWFSRDRIRGYGEACAVHRTGNWLHIARTKDKLYWRVIYYLYSVELHDIKYIFQVIHMHKVINIIHNQSNITVCSVVFHSLCKITKYLTCPMICEKRDNVNNILLMHPVHLKRILSDGFHHLSKWYFGSKGVAMINHWFSISIPTIELNTAAALAKSPAHHTHTRTNTHTYRHIHKLLKKRQAFTVICQ